MGFQFATCERHRALGFLKKGLPEQPDLADTPDSLGPLLDLVQADIIRITDPDYHALQITQGKKWDESRLPEIREAAKAIEHRQEITND